MKLTKVEPRDFRITPKLGGRTYFRWCPNGMWTAYMDGRDEPDESEKEGVFPAEEIMFYVNQGAWQDFQYVMDPIDVLIDELDTDRKA